MAALNFQIDPLLSFIEGCGYVSDVARLRFVQSVTGSLLAWGALASHHGLFAPSMMMFGMASSSLVGLARKHRLLLGLLRYRTRSNRIRWSEEVWPFQWRIAVSWFCGYFIFCLFNPVLFAYRGPVEAGQMGMTLSLVNAIQNIAVSWVSTKSAPFGTLIARKEYGRLDHTFFQALRQTFAVSLAGALTAWLGCMYLNLQHLRFAQRLLDPFTLALLLIYMMVNVIVFAESFLPSCAQAGGVFHQFARRSGDCHHMHADLWAVLRGEGNRGKLLHRQYYRAGVVDLQIPKVPKTLAHSQGSYGNQRLDEWRSGSFFGPLTKRCQCRLSLSPPSLGVRDEFCDCLGHEVEHRRRQSRIYAHPKHMVHHEVRVTQLSGHAILTTLVGRLAQQITAEEKARADLVRVQRANQVLAAKGGILAHANRKTKP